MLAGAPDRARDELIAALGPCYGAASVDRVAVNAVLSGVEALCDERRAPTA